MKLRRCSKLMMCRLSHTLLAFALLESGSSLVVQQSQQHRAHLAGRLPHDAYIYGNSNGSGAASIACFLPRGQPPAKRARCIAASTISKNDLESTFYSFDADSSGDIDLDELKGALDNLGLAVSDDDARKLFRKYATDGGGTIGLEDFKRLISDEAFADTLPQRQITYAMDLFQKYDEDGSGSIDKNEFLAIARKMKQDSSRRELISVAAAAYGAFVVSESSFEFQFAQKQLRSKYVDQAAEDSQNFYFPTAMLSGDLDKAIARTLKSRGFTPENTLFAHSVCSDEVNNRKEQVSTCIRMNGMIRSVLLAIYLIILICCCLLIFSPPMCCSIHH
mmetsp:Transcript_26275/g.77689  ORF Transcript_26275/g.77689 Transcript_26275/m.77689 type:complete len:334 (-) Transcript_26275:752-1753(-)